MEIFKNKKAAIYAIMTLIAVLILYIFIFVTSVKDMRESKIEYTDLTYMELTVKDVRSVYHSDDGYKYYISVNESDKTVFVNDLLAKSDIRKGLDALDDNEKIYCYAKEDGTRYNAVEIKTDNDTVLSIEEYRYIYRKNALLGFIAIPIILVLFISSALIRDKWFQKNRIEE